MNNENINIFENEDTDIMDWETFGDISGYYSMEDIAADYYGELQ